MCTKSEDRYDHIEIEIVKILENLATESNDNGWLWNRGRWTKEIKSHLCNLAKNNLYEVSSNQCDGATWGEWLYDMTWYKEDQYGNMISMPLILECEWNPDIPIDPDFQKLIQSRAERRIYIFEQSENCKIKQKIDRHKQEISKFNYSHAGDRYLFAGIGWKPRDFTFDLFIFK